jgi:hypothetical protein
MYDAIPAGKNLANTDWVVKPLKVSIDILSAFLDVILAVRIRKIASIVICCFENGDFMDYHSDACLEGAIRAHSDANRCAVVL